MENDRLIIGDREVWGRQRPFGLLPADRARHLYIIGQTGTGKSTLIAELVRQDIEAGAGVALLDPHGDLIDEVLTFVPSRRIDDVILIDTADREWPLALNPFYRVPEDERPLVAANLVATMKHAWSDSWGPRLQYILGNAVGALLEAPDSCRPTMLGVARLLVERPYREQVLHHVQDPRIRSFWREEFDHWPDRQVAEALSPVQNKLGELLANRFVRNILCQWRPSFDLPAVMDRGQVLLVRLSKGTLGEEPANLLGALLVSGIQQAAMRRADTAAASRRPFHLYIDEFQNFTTDTFAAALSETRKYGLTLTLAHQYVGQLREPVREAVFGNVGNIVSFRVAGSDADVLAREMGKFLPAIFRDLNRGEVCASVLEAGEGTEPFRGRTRRSAPVAGGQAEKVREQSRQRYGRWRKTVERNVGGWLSGINF
jgi:hypothetical protein